VPRFLRVLVPEETFGGKWLGFFMGQVMFLSPNQQCQSTEEDSEHRP